MAFQPLFKPNRWTIIALMVAATALTGATVYYGISQIGQTTQPSEPAQTVPTIKQITALGRLEPASEIVRVSAPVTLNKDRVAQLLVKRGDRVKVGQVITILDSRDRLQNALLEAQKRVKVAEARLAQARDGAQAGEIAAQEGEIARFPAGLKGEAGAGERWSTSRRDCGTRSRNRSFPGRITGRDCYPKSDHRSSAIRAKRRQCTIQPLSAVVPRGSDRCL